MHQKHTGAAQERAAKEMQHQRRLVISQSQNLGIRRR